MAPMVENGDDDPWFCNLCQAKQQDRRPPWYDPDSRSFDHLRYILDEKNPSSYQLPQALREYFTDVKTGADGEYEEVIPPPAPKITK